MIVIKDWSGTTEMEILQSLKEKKKNKLSGDVISNGQDLVRHKPEVTPP